MGEEMTTSVIDAYFEQTLPAMLNRWSQQFYMSGMGEQPLKNGSVMPIFDQNYIPNERDLVFAYLCSQESDFFSGDYGEFDMREYQLYNMPDPCFDVGQMVADTRFNQYVSCRETEDSAVNIFGTETVFDTYGFIASSFAEACCHNANIKRGIDAVKGAAGDYVESNVSYKDIEIPSDIILDSDAFYWKGTLRGLTHDKSSIRSVSVCNLMVCAEQMNFCRDVFKQAIFTNIKKRHMGCSELLSLVLISADDKETKLNFVNDLIKMFDERQAKSDIDKVKVNLPHEQEIIGSPLRDEYAPLNETDKEDLETVLKMIQDGSSDMSKVAPSIASGLEGIKKAAKETLAKMSN
jgi:hypothetical protein